MGIRRKQVKKTQTKYEKDNVVENRNVMYVIIINARLKPSFSFTVIYHHFCVHLLRCKCSGP